MKKIHLIIMAIVLIAVTVLIITIEKNKLAPMERYLKTTQATKQTEKYVPVKIKNDTENLQYEFLSYDLIDDKDIETQTKYKAEFFVEGKVPPSDYVVKNIDFDAMAGDYPEFDEYRNSNHESGMTKDEYEEFKRLHTEEYTTYQHVKTKYLFVRCIITYIGGGRNEEWISDFGVFVMRGNKLLDDVEINCYFDHSQHTDEEHRTHDFFLYKFDRVGDSIECVLGCRLTGEYYDLSEDNTYYIGFRPGVSYSDNDQFNPAIDSRCVAIADMPEEA